MSLTKKQKEVLDYIVQGLTNLEIAEKMNLQIVTVKMHVSAILRKYRLQNRYQLIAKFYRNELVSNPGPSQVI